MDTLISINDDELKQKLFQCYAEKIERNDLNKSFAIFGAGSLSVQIEFEGLNYQINFYFDNVFYYLIKEN